MVQQNIVREVSLHSGGRAGKQQQVASQGTSCDELAFEGKCN